MPDKVLLDTHVWVWYFDDDPKLPHALAQKLDYVKRHGTFFISPISIWEISMLECKKRLRLDPSAWEWIERGLSYTNVSFVDLTPKIAWRANNLPGAFHSDPMDAMLIATVLETGLTLATCDTKLLAYAKKYRIKVV